MTTITAYTHCMREAFSTAYDYLNALQFDQTMNPPDKRIEIWNKPSFIETFDFIREGSSVVNSRQIDDMIRNFTKKPANMSSVRSGICQETPTGVEKGYVVKKNPGLFTVVKEECQKAFLELQLKDRSFKVEPRIIISALTNATSECQKILIPEGYTGDDAKKRQKYSDKFSAYLSMAISHILLYFTKAILKFLELCSHPDLEVKHDIVIFHSFIPKYDVQRPTFGKNIANGLEEKYKENKEIIFDALAFGGIKANKKSIDETVSKAFDLLQKGTDALKNGQGINDIVPDVVGLIRGFGNLLGDGKTKEETDADLMQL